jgi:hypothetical protein
MIYNLFPKVMTAFHSIAVNRCNEARTTFKQSYSSDLPGGKGGPAAKKKQAGEKKS